MVWETSFTCHSLVIHHGYIQITSDHSLFVKKNVYLFRILFVYVDGVIFARDSLAKFQHMKNIIHEAFKTKDLGILKYILGLEVAHSKQEISPYQRKYCTDLLTYSRFLGSKPATTSFDPSIKLCHDNNHAFEDISTHRRLIGRQIYLNPTKPNISFITQ